MPSDKKERKVTKNKKDKGAKDTEVDEEKGSKSGHKSPTVVSGLKSFFLQWINILLVFIPVGIVLGIIKSSPTAVFITNFLAIIPLAKLLGTATENVAVYTGQAIGALLNATFGNAVELILGIIALVKGLITVVQGSLLGSVLSNLLLVLGMSFVVGGAKYKIQTFSKQAAQTNGGILLMAVFGALLPAALHAQLTDTETPTNSTGANQTLEGESAYLVHADPQLRQKILSLSRAASIVLLIVYGLYLFFQLYTHKEFYTNEEDNEDAESEMPLWMSIVALLGVTVLVAICAEYLVGAIEGITEAWGISKSFVGLIILPIVGNAAEHVTAVTMAYKNKMDLSIGVAIGSSQQIALMVTPFLVILGWIINQDMTLYFAPFETAVLFICVIVVNAIIMDGKSNWLEGVMLMAVYIICAVAFYQLPSHDN